MIKSIIKFIQIEQLKKASWQFNLSNVKLNQVTIDSTEYDCLIETYTTKFKKNCTDLLKIDEKARIVCHETFVMLESTNLCDDEKEIVSKAGRIFYRTDNEAFVKCTKSFKREFAVKYFIPFLENISYNRIITLYVHHLYPLRMKYRLEDNICCEYYVAPKMDET